MAPTDETSPHNAHTIMDNPADPVDWRTPLGLMKIPDPTIDPTIMAMPFIKPNWRSIVTLLLLLASPPF